MPTALLFTGHMVDLPGRGTPRFPQQLTEAARRMIGERLDPYAGQAGVGGFASLARGGDILFHEECQARGIPTTVVLPFPPAKFIPTSVEGVPGADWQTRFWTIWNATPDDRRECLNLAARDAAYTAGNRRILERAEAHGEAHLIALWDGKPGDGPGGAADLVEQASRAGDKPDVLFFKSCFVVMGFGEKTDAATGRKLNLDQTYKNVIKPAVEAAGFMCVRADEILHSGVIDIPMYEMLLYADLVVADLSTSNLNATFELGVRHALRPRATIIVAEKQFTSPFDVNHILINKYEHLGTDIGFDETVRMRGVLTQLAEVLKAGNRTDSPVYSSMQDLEPPRRGAARPAPVAEGERAGPAIGAPSIALAAAPPVERAEDSYAAHLELAAAEKQKGNWGAAKAILQEIYRAQTAGSQPDNPRAPRPRIVQELALATYKAGERDAKTAGADVAEAGYAEAIDLLMQLGPAHSTDPETLGLWAAVHKRRSTVPDADTTRRRADLDEAIYASERGFLIRQDYYTGVNLAFLLESRASLTRGRERVADQVLADRVRHRVIDFAAAQTATLTDTLARAGLEASPRLREELYWCQASLAEARIGLLEKDADELLQKVLDSALEDWMAASTKRQIAALKELLAARDREPD